MTASAYVLINAVPQKISEVLSNIRKASSVNSAYAVTGPYDIIAYIEEEDINEVGKAVVFQIQGVEGVTKTLTCMVVEV
jgi:DNA-binding Lrp family transcriptional regulator